MRWTTADIPDRTGSTILVTGATSGLGLDVVRALAGTGAHLVLAARNPSKTDQVLADLRADHPDGSFEPLECDLADLASVHAGADRFLSRHDRLDVLYLNAGVMATPLRRTAQGFELQIGTNHLGHFALTGLLLARLRTTAGSRVVVTSSLAARIGRVRLDDLNWERRRYERWQAYAQSKLANLLFTVELQRRLTAADAPTLAVAAHPGYAATHLQQAGPELEGGTWGQVKASAFGVANRLVAQSSADGAVPLLYAGTAPDVAPAGYYGPSGPFEGRGRTPAPARLPAAVGDADLAVGLWELSEGLTGIRT